MRSAGRMRHAASRVAGCLLALWLVGCGGGGGGGGGTTPPPAVVSNVRAADSVPQVGQALITEVVAPTANAPFGAPVPLTAAAAGADQPVLALDRAGHIVLAAMATGTVAAMDADSTALALVRLAYGALPSDRSAAAFNADIRATASFVALRGSLRNLAPRRWTPPIGARRSGMC